ncbi:SBBP repeat-containing protein [candidate division KSB1 bacterium]|nr:SBBP repeat-containing protein [candidate division KSB1 bacterium]
MRQKRHLLVSPCPQFFCGLFFLSAWHILGQQVGTPVLEWERHYPANDTTGTYSASALVVDESGTVYVTGQEKPDYFRSEIVTIKYNAEGDVIWTARYDRDAELRDLATGIALDELGNVYVVGSTENFFESFDLLTIKYNPAGEEEWVQILDTNLDDTAVDMAIDPNGSLIVVGTRWDRFMPPFYASYITVKYDFQGNELWQDLFDSAGAGLLHAKALALDHLGNIYVLGTSWRDLYENFNIVTVKYTPDGTVQGYVVYDGPYDERAGNYFFSFDEAQDIAVDAQRNVYVCGSSQYEQDSLVVTAAAIIKYDQAGSEKWRKLYNYSANSADAAKVIQIDSAGTIYVSGSTYGSGKTTDFLTLKLDSRGNLLWSTVYQTDDYAGVLKSELDVSGYLYVSGSPGSYYKENVGCTTIKYDIRDGTPVWSHRYKGLGEANLADLAIDQQNHIYITGRSFGENWSTFSTVKYSQNGSRIDRKNAAKSSSFVLRQNVPNPFNPETQITFVLPEQSYVTVDIYNVNGRYVKTVLDAEIPAGSHTLVWDGRDSAGLRLPSGIYVYRLCTSEFSDARKMLLVR